jgi:endoglucanase
MMTTGVNDVASKVTTLNVYPNPATDNVTFGFDLTGTPAATNLVVYDATGRVVNTINGTSLKTGKNEVSLNVSNLPAGMYIVRLQGEGAAASARFSVVK